MNLVLIGFKNCGKTSVGKLVSEKTKKSFIDTDRLVEKQHQLEEKISLTCREIYKTKGSPYFRNLEKNVIASLAHIQNHIIATGGGSLLDNDNVIHLKKRGRLIYLNTPLNTLIDRLSSESTPAFLDAEDPKNDFINLYSRRDKIYKQSADLEINTNNKSIEALSEEIITLINGGF